MSIEPSAAIALLNARIAAANATIDGTLPSGEQPVVFTLETVRALLETIKYLDLAAKRALPIDAPDSPARRGADFASPRRPSNEVPA